jgi:hypothetical protein
MVAKVLTFTALLAVLAAAASAAATAKVGCDGKCYSSRSCEYGFKCVGGACKKTGIPAGGSCPSTCYVCATGLKCSKTTKTCELPIVRVKCGESCAINKACEKGSSCIDDKCIHEVTVAGGSCSRAGCDVCKGDLTCTNGVCTKRLSDCKGACEADADCVAGLKCDGGVCKNKDVAVGGSCAVKDCDVCLTGLLCTNSVCTKPLVKCSGACTASTDCEAGLSCFMGKCTSFVGIGQTCKDGCHACKPGYVCISKYGKYVCVPTYK